MLKEIMTEGECSQLRSLIDTAETIVLCCHVNADGDALGSMLGWAEVLRGMGKNPLIVAPDQYPDYLKWLPNTEKMASSPAKKVLIDHHLEPDVDAVLTISHPEMSSTCELVFRIVWQMGLFEQQGKHFAIPVYCGMMTDTGGFTYNSSSPDIYFIISQLLTKHIDKDKIYRHVYHNYSEHRIRMVGYVLCHKLVVDEQRHAAFYTLTREDLQRFHFIKGDAEGLVNMPLQIKGLKLSISLREDSERDKLIWISLRSVDDFPCNKMAEMFFNGGGHLNASGGKLMCTMDEAVEVVKQAILHFEDTLK